MRKLLAALLVVALTAAFFVGCGGSGDKDSTSVPPASASETPVESPDETPVESPEESVTVTFRQEGQADVVKTVVKGNALTDIPTPSAVKGYTVEWDTKDFGKIDADTVVNAVATANVYTITFDYGNSGFEGPATMTVTYDGNFKLPENQSASVAFKGVSWKIDDTDETLSEGKYTIDHNITVKFVYTEKSEFVEV